MKPAIHYVKQKTRIDRAAFPFLLNNCINYITPVPSEPGVRGFMPHILNDQPIYEVIATHGGTCFKIVRLDVYPPRTIATFKPKLYVKCKRGYAPYIGALRQP